MQQAYFMLTHTYINAIRIEIFHLPSLILLRYLLESQWSDIFCVKNGLIVNVVYRLSILNAPNGSLTRCEVNFLCILDRLWPIVSRSTYRPSQLFSIQIGPCILFCF
jgi:hypothetical protein